MPRVNPLRSLANERNLAERIAFERSQRGWSYEGLAQRMARAACPIQSSAIFKIEKGNPPRRVTVDELVGFATVFEVSVSDLLIPVELVHDRHYAELLSVYRDLAGELDGVVIGMRDLLLQWKALRTTKDGSQAFSRLFQRSLSQMSARLEHFAGATMDDIDAAEAAADAAAPYPQSVREAVKNLTAAIEKWVDDDGQH